MLINYKYVFYFVVVCFIILGSMLASSNESENKKNGDIILGLFVTTLIFIILYELMEMKIRRNIADRGSGHNVYIPTDMNDPFYFQ